MTRLRCLVVAFCVLVVSTTAFAQVISQPTHYCSYTATPLAAELYLSPEKVDVVEQMVSDICTDAGQSCNFTLAAANVPSVAALQHQGQSYLLYNSAYCRQLQARDPRALYTLLAHEIGHLVHQHPHQSPFRVFEESQADEFMARTLFKSRGFADLEEVLLIVRTTSYAYEKVYAYPLRQRTITRAWLAEEAIVKSAGNLGYLSEESVRDDLPLPHFELRGCPRWKGMDARNFSQCQNLAQVDHLLTQALDRLGYDHRSYFALPNGFALMTHVEQIHPDGTSLPGNERWVDYPAGQDFEDIFDYISSLFVSRPGYFRLFIFTITTSNINNNRQTVNAKSARAWLYSGGDFLPPVIGTIPLTTEHRPGMYIFEFEAPESTQRMEQYCDQRLSLQQHLKGSGLIRLILP